MVSARTGGNFPKLRWPSESEPPRRAISFLFISELSKDQSQIFFINENARVRGVPPLSARWLEFRLTYCISSLQEADGATVQKNVFPLHFAVHE